MEAGDEVLVSDAYVGLEILTSDKSNRDQCSTPARITILGRMQVYQRVTSTLITQLRVYSVSC